ncbi:hypothetical protein Q9S36_29460 [Microbacterium sp. ARD31]|uniref:hypothetical protein n=1 Tax=Microbacterium sp. ARD31 TaxID=2962576 RepID=UPI002882C898|nr:hypothetical protein [Microbacterium sp. ARD31]MDT0184330.1 hypothetical protein [Microbacterium sp. ARD31]
MTIFNSDDVSTEDAEATSRNYTPSAQELAEEIPDEVEDSRLTDGERQALNGATTPVFEPISGNGVTREPSPSFVPPSDGWVHPKILAKRRQQSLFPSLRALDDLDERVGSAMRFDGAPERVRVAETAARDAIAAARQIRADGAHLENSRYAKNAAAKDAAALAAADAVRAVGALEAVVEQAGDEWLDGLVSQIPAMQKRAAKTLEAAFQAYAEWRQTIAAADDLSRAQGRFGDWHRHVDERELNPLGLIREIRRARDLAKTNDPYLSGQYLVDDPTPEGEIPEWTLASLERAASIAPGSFAESQLMRLRSPHAADAPARETIEAKDLRVIATRPIPALNPQQEEWDRHARAVDPTR